MPSFAFGSHHHLANPIDSPYSVEISVDGDSSDLDSLSEVDLESGGVTAPEKNLHSCGKKRRTRRRKKRRKKKKKGGRDCRICHLPLETNKEDEEDDENSDEQEEDEEEEGREDDEEEYYGLPLQLGCSCKGDLGVAHTKCAETWFKIKGNMTCEICGAMAINVAGEQSNAESTASAQSQAAAGQTQTQTEPPRGMWHGRRVMNFLLAAMVFAFIVSWLFHFKVLK
ncbi:unnamed protein product [Microthlaspi erraticum]|uniref:RING-CH-type domain-containing protein n=1 Tax=Microthlaspi erraticum TaxID=1685480 RepID=A0A6D2IXH4_9BRAS|nr:unnamed protein product [Microthlaspi erraticum]